MNFLLFEYIHSGIPIIDLNNLFKYAVPKAIIYLMGHKTHDRISATEFIFTNWLKEYIESGCVDFALALAEALEKALGIEP